MITIIQLEVHHKNPMPDLTDKVADRIYRMQGVQDVTVKVVMPQSEVKASKDNAGEYF